ncbi:MAG: class II aldolase/adducin family protein [Proteobacteria bacterium]|nr:class II aldolase/adducin family protein [Pseudomonadota bacterium]MBI3495906.1 class II aldolase/adducin family protein [Pseudomonadota bacterium]
MTVLRQVNPETSARADAEEWQLRCDMAAVFRVCARLEMNDQIGNHNSLMLPGSASRFLINPRGMLFQELRASDLITCDLDGKVLAGKGELRKVAFHIHARIHLKHPQARCVLHVHPIYTTALSLVEGGRLELAHQANLLLNDRIAYDDVNNGPVHDNEEGDRIASLLGAKTILIMASHGVTVVGQTVHGAFDELYCVERNAMYQVTAMQIGRPLRRQDEALRRNYNGPWENRVDARMHLDAWRRILDREEPDYAS